MQANGIRHRADLVDALHGVSQPTIYRAFNDTWAGKASLPVLAALSLWSGKPVWQLVETLVVDPHVSYHAKSMRAKARTTR